MTDVLNRFGIDDGYHARFGQLIKDWARGIKQPPADLDAFKQQLEDEGIKASYPTGANELKTLNVFRADSSRLDIRLPPTDFLDDSESFIVKHGYVIPKFYHDAFDSEPTIDDVMVFHAARIGDYTLANCT
ncbi:hypothetical protein [Nisaea sediminum]|uniref:hypothetical protein n=1 Tax=Nisaea sediminum TaxID=2775867 RepID=UPI0018695E58|nr:hypothetical protein [Nisaea sediminum]